MLQARERTPTPFSSNVFTFELIVESFKEFGGASFGIKLHNNQSYWQT
jgi:hypothetical protein